MRIATYEHDGATLVSGDVIGDEVTMAVQGIGHVFNRVVAGVEPVDAGEPRRRG